VNRALLAASLLLTALAYADDKTQPAKLTERSRLEVQPVDGTPIKLLSIDNPLGDVKIEGYDGDSLQIETVKSGPDTDAIDRMRVSLVPNPDGTVRLKTTADAGKDWKPLNRDRIRVDLIIHAPHSVRIDAATSAGRLDVSKMDGGGDLDSGAGAIHVSNVQGDFATHSVNGPTSLSVVFGSVDAQTLASDLDLDTIGGENLVATVDRGKIAGRRVRSRNVELTTTEGKIFLEAEASLRGHLVVSSLRGDIDVKLRRTGAANVRVRGTKVNFSGPMGQVDRSSSDGWVATHLGRIPSQMGQHPQEVGRGPQQLDDAPAVVQMQSRYGIVSFTVVE
jgi:hypothetical protein